MPPSSLGQRGSVTNPLSELLDRKDVDGFAYDMNVACSSATFGIETAANAIRSGSARRVLMVNPDQEHLDGSGPRT